MWSQSIQQYWGLQGDLLLDDALTCVAYDPNAQFGYAAGQLEDVTSLNALTGASINTTTIGSTVTAFGDQDIVLFKFTMDGAIIWAQVIGGTHDDQALGICIDAAGNLYLAGSYMANLHLGSVDGSASTTHKHLSVRIIQMDNSVGPMKKEEVKMMLFIRSPILQQGWWPLVTLPTPTTNHFRVMDRHHLGITPTFSLPNTTTTVQMHGLWLVAALTTTIHIAT
jgi:hypothetical protein